MSTTKKSIFLLKMDLVLPQENMTSSRLPRLQQSLRIVGRQIRKLPSRIRRAARRGLERVLVRLGIKRHSERKLKLERFQSSTDKIFNVKRRGSRGAEESSGFISEEELEDEDFPPDYSNTELKMKIRPTDRGNFLTETDGPIEIEMIVFK